MRWTASIRRSFHWQGDPRRHSLRGDWSPAGAQELFVGAWPTARWRVTRMQLTPLDVAEVE